MIVGLFINHQKEESFQVASRIIDYLRGHKCVIHSPHSEFDLPPLNKELDYGIVIGGDGTILRLFHHYPDLKAPILGINIGHLGFLTDVTLSDLDASLDDFIRGDFDVQERLVMEGSTSAQTFFAINDIVIHRAKDPSLVDLSIHVDGVYLNTFSADGIILATPTGSTAYSLAAGGPILSPELDAIVVTPICPHTISNRPLVLRPSQQIEVRNLRSHSPVEITYDGVSRYALPMHEVVRAHVSRQTFKMVKLRRTDYFATLRTKLNWSGQVRYTHST